MAEKIIRGVYRLPIPLTGSPLKELNVYLLLDDKRCLLIDTGFREDTCRNALFSQLREFGLEPGDVDVLLTHLHSDHSGLAAEAAGEQGRIYISRPDFEFLTSRKEENSNSLLVRFLEDGFPEELMIQDDNPVFQPISPDEHPMCVLEDNQVLTVGGYRLECLSMPGHTPGHMCFYCREEQLIFLGDHVLFDISPNITAWPNFPDALGVFMESLNRIKNLHVKYALPAHRSSGNLAYQAERLLRHHERRLQEALQLVRDYPGQSAYVLASKMHWKIRTKSNSWEEFPVTQRWFAVGECMSHLDHLISTGKICRKLLNGKAAYYPLVETT